MIESSSKFLTAQKFSQEIEESVFQFDGSYIDTMIWLCDKKSVDLESVSKLLLSQIREKIASEAEAKNLIKKVKKLPLE